MRNFILTGFGPYGKFTLNMSSEITKRFPFKSKAFHLIKKTIPVSWNRSIASYELLFSELESTPDLVILLGIHSSKEFHIEKFGWNFKLGKDIENIFKFGPIKVYFPPWIKTNLNLRDIYSIIEDKSFVSISNFAGLYLCNYLYYWALYLSKKEYPVIFIHVPEKGNISDCIRKIKMILKAIIKRHFKEDL